MKKLLALLVLMPLLAAGCGEVPTMPPAGEVPTPTTASYPVPLTHTPAPPGPTLPTLTPRPIVLPTPRPTYSGPPKETQVVTPMAPFPTPAFPTPPPGTPPADLGTIWYPYFPSPDSRPVLRAVLVDGQGRRWGEWGHVIDLGLPVPHGPALPMPLELHTSPDGDSFIADVGAEQIESYWINPFSGEVRSIAPDAKDASLLAWGPDHRVLALVLVGPGGLDQQGRSVWLVDLDTQEHREVIFPVSEYGFLLAHAFALSPDGLWIADASRYDKAQGNEVEIGLQPLAEGDRVALALIAVPDRVTILGLDWSPDGQRLALTLLTGIGDGDPSNDDVQLRLISRDNGGQTVLAHGLCRTNSWSPDGRYIAFTRTKNPGQDQSPIDLWLFDLTTSLETQLTNYADRRVTSAAWSPDGQRLAFGVTMGNYGEIWITSLDASEQYPVAGPTAPRAPLTWLPAMEGGQ